MASKATKKYSWYNMNPFAKGKGWFRRGSDLGWYGAGIDLVGKGLGLWSKGKMIKAREGQIVIGKNVDKELL